MAGPSRAQVAAHLRARQRALGRLEVELTAALRRAFLLQGHLLVERLGRLRPYFREALPVPGFDQLFDEAALLSLQAFTAPLDAATMEALVDGAKAVAAWVGVEARFDVQHPAAVRYLGTHGAERVTRINAATRGAIRRILERGASQGWSYDRVAAEIRRRYAQFAGPPLRVRPRHIRSRAHAVAVYELGNAYEAGAEAMARDLIGAGLTLEKAWLTVGDARVRPAHRENERVGWVPYDQPFPDGSVRPPTDPGCRCTLLVRQAEEKEEEEEEEEQPAESVPEPGVEEPQRRPWDARRVDLEHTSELISALAGQQDPAVLEDVFSRILAHPDGLRALAEFTGVPLDKVRAWPRAKQIDEVTRLHGTLVSEWGEMSWPEHPSDKYLRWSLHLQMAAIEEFGVKEPWLRFPRADIERHLDPGKMTVARVFLRAQYDATQQWLADRGYDYVPLVRGMGAGTARASGLKQGQTGRIDFTLAPLSSFSANPHVANMFGHNGLMATAWVPREYVVGVAATGLGVPHEAEVVVLGGPVQVMGERRG